MSKLPSDSVVVDASYILNLLLPDEKSTHEQVSHHMYAPTVLTYEVINGIHSSFLQKRIDAKLANALYQDFCKLPITLKTPDYKESLNLAIEHNLSGYDASYLWLTQNLQVPLISHDKALVRLAN